MFLFDLKMFNQSPYQQSKTKIKERGESKFILIFLYMHFVYVIENINQYVMNIK